jgi:hypothetical protein
MLWFMALPVAAGFSSKNAIPFLPSPLIRFLKEESIIVIKARFTFSPAIDSGLQRFAVRP